MSVVDGEDDIHLLMGTLRTTCAELDELSHADAPALASQIRALHARYAAAVEKMDKGFEALSVKRTLLAALSTGIGVATRDANTSADERVVLAEGMACAARGAQSDAERMKGAVEEMVRMTEEVRPLFQQATMLIHDEAVR